MAGTSSAKTRFGMLPGHDENAEIILMQKSRKCRMPF
jgi:hypothetical protein